MNEGETVKLVEDTLEVAESMQSTWAMARRAIRLSELKNMTASHLLEIMALNGIRFCLKNRFECP